MPCTEYWANQIAVAAKGGAAFAGPATIYLALCSDTPTKAVAGTPVVYTGYARPGYAQSDFASDDIGNLVNSAAAVTFPTPTGGGKVTAAALFTRLPISSLAKSDCA